MLDGFRKAVDEKKPSELEYRIVRYGDKQVRWVHGLGRLQFNEDGQPVSMLGTIQDITESKQAEEQLRESEKQSRKVFEEGPLGILLVGTNGQIQHTNQHFCDMLGYSESEIIALGLPELSPRRLEEGSSIRFTPLERRNLALPLGETLSSQGWPDGVGSTDGFADAR